MKASVVEDIYIRPVPRNVYAPWLNERSNKVELVRDFVVRIVDEDGEVHWIVVPRGYVSDWSSIPRFLWVVFAPNYSEARRGAVLHDYIYSHLYWYYSKEFADKAMVALMEKDNASKASRTSFYWSVRLGGKGGWYYKDDPTQHEHWRIKHEDVPYEKDDPILDKEIDYGEVI